MINLCKLLALIKLLKPYKFQEYKRIPDILANQKTTNQYLHHR